MHRLAARAGVPRAVAALCTSTALTPVTASRRWCSSSTPGKVKVHIKSQVEDKERTVEAPVGMTLMEVIRDVAKMDMEAACDGTCACSTCHVIFDAESYKKLLDTPSEDEMDMLDLAPSVTKTSRLSCQVQITEELDDITVTIPNETDNQMGH